MPQYKLICNHGENTHIEYRFQAETLHDLLPEIEQWLRGCGFYIKGSLDIIDENYNS